MSRRRADDQLPARLRVPAGPGAVSPVGVLGLLDGMETSADGTGPVRGASFREGALKAAKAIAARSTSRRKSMPRSFMISV
jgi:hypothetical protein